MVCVVIDSVGQGWAIFHKALEQAFSLHTYHLPNIVLVIAQTLFSSLLFKDPVKYVLSWGALTEY